MTAAPPSALCMFAVLLTTLVATSATASVAFDDKAETLDSNYLDEHSTHSRSLSDWYAERRLEDSGTFEREVEIEDILVFVVLAIVVLVLAFPVAVFTYCMYCPRVICCLVRSPRDTPPSVVDITEGPSSDYHFVTQVSSTSMSTSDEFQMI